jgi:hypothetical protein
MPSDAIAPDEHPTGGMSNIGVHVLKELRAGLGDAMSPLRNTSRAGVHPWTCPLHPVGLTGFVSLAEVLVFGGALDATVRHA